ncbi:hypothetical protein LSH36_260g02003, partial [Paralvinella palmiformis]
NSEESMEMLLAILDPNKCDPEINIDTYRRGTDAWIQQLNNQTPCDSDGLQNDTTDVFSNSLPSSPAHTRPLINRFLQLNITSQSSHLISPIKPAGN